MFRDNIQHCHVTAVHLLLFRGTREVLTAIMRLSALSISYSYKLEEDILIALSSINRQVVHIIRYSIM